MNRSLLGSLLLVVPACATDFSAEEVALIACQDAVQVDMYRPETSAFPRLAPGRDFCPIERLSVHP